MDRIREWSFPVVLLTAWIAIAGYTLSSLGEAHARMTAARKVVPPAENATAVVSKHLPLVRKTQKPVVHRGPRA